LRVGIFVFSSLWRIDYSTYLQGIDHVWTCIPAPIQNMD
jgi:hypothetical protein